MRSTRFGSKTRGVITPSTDHYDRQETAGVSGKDYDRRRDLAPLLAFWPWEIEDLSEGAQVRLITMIRKALRIERQRGVAGHWAYDVARHARLLRAYKAEIKRGNSQGERERSPWPAQLSRRDECPGPFSSPTPIAQPHNSARPSDSRVATPTSPDTPPETGCSGCEGAA